MKLTSYRKYRLLEMLPGTVAWSTVLVIILLSFVQPLWMVTFAIIFDLYWLMRVLYFIYYLSYSWRVYRRQKNIAWMEKVQSDPRWKDVHHLIFLPTVDEDIAVLRHTFEGLKNSSFPKEKMVVILAGEGRMEESFRKTAEIITREYGNLFYALLVTVHPQKLPGEIASKGANLHWAGEHAKVFVDAQGWNEDLIIVSSFDVDTYVHQEYFAHLTYTYLHHPHPTRASYQPLALYNNNVWESPSFARVVANSTTFWLMAELARPKPLWTFSSHSMSYRALVDVGFWQNDIVTEDSRIFLQCFIHYDGDYEVVPMYIPVFMDTAYAGTMMGTVKNLYKQQRRWAWGIEHFPFMVWHFWKSKLPRKKWSLVFNLTEGMYSWSTAPLIILVIGYLPLLIASDAEKATVIAQTVPHILKWIMRVALIGIFLSAVMNVYLLPEKIPGNKLLKIGVMVLQWILLPITLILFGAIPAFDAQTRLLLGKYLGFYTTKKARQTHLTQTTP